MPRNATSAKRKWLVGTGAVAAVAVLGIVGAWLAGECDFCEAANDILLQKTIAQNCTISVSTHANAANLPLNTSGTQHVQVGTVNQNCNKKIGYTLVVTSTNCATAPARAKLIDPVSSEYLAISAEFANPVTGGSTASVTGLLASACAAQIGRDVTNAKIINEDSTVYVNFDGDTTLGAGSYEETLTITMSVKT